MENKPTYEELQAQVEALKDWRRLALQFDGHRMQAMSTLKMVATGNFDMEEVRRFIAAAPVSGEQHLAEIRANAAIKGWWACWEWVDSDDRDKLTLIPAADKYADKIRQEVK